MTPSPEILARTDLPPPDSSESGHLLPCSASTVRDKNVSIKIVMQSIALRVVSYIGRATIHSP